MHLVALIAIAIVALLHLGFAYLEMVIWKQPAGLRIFGMTAESAKASAKLAENQGVYNILVAAGLFWSALGSFAGDDAFHVQLFFLGYVVVVGLYGGITTNRSILYYQGLPALIAAGLVLAAH